MRVVLSSVSTEGFGAEQFSPLPILSFRLAGEGGREDGCQNVNAGNYRGVINSSETRGREGTRKSAGGGGGGVVN